MVLNHYDSSSIAKPVDVLLVPRLHLDLMIEVVVALCRHVLVLDREGEHPISLPPWTTQSEFRRWLGNSGRSMVRQSLDRGVVGDTY